MGIVITQPPAGVQPLAGVQPPVATTQIINTGAPITTTPTAAQQLAAQQLQDRLNGVSPATTPGYQPAGSPPAGSPSAGPAGSPSAGSPIPGLPPFKSIEKALLPLSGKQIHQFRGKVRKTQEGGDEPIVPKNGITQVITVDPNSGETPTIHMAAGYACSLTVVDGAGQPWPIVTAVIGSGKRFTAQNIDKNALEPTIVVSDLLPHAQSNLLLTLQGLNTPIPVQLVSGGPLEHGKETVAYRVILRVRGMVPGGLPASFSPSPNHGTTAALLQTRRMTR